MTPQLLVQKMQAVLDVAPDFDDIYAVTLAETYARLTREANMRLGQCRDLITRQLFSEALSVAEAVPALTDLCDQLTFPGLDAWTELCAFSRWPVPEPVPVDIGALNQLKAAYASNRILEPLQKLFRTSVRLGMTRETLQLIGRLEKADPDNPNWRMNRTEFEKKRLGELRAEFETCRAAPEEPVLRTMLGEISAMTCCSDDALTNQIVPICERLERERLNAAAGRVIAHLSEAYSALNVEEGQRYLARYRQLRDTGKVTETESMRLQHEEAAAWLEEENRKARAEADYRDAENDVRTLVEDAADEGVEEALARLGSFGRADDSRDLTERALKLIAHNRRKRRWRQALFLALSVASSLFFIVCLVTVLQKRHFEAQVHDAVAALSLAFNAEDVEGFAAQIQFIQNKRPRVLRDARVRAAADRLDTLKQGIADREARFQSCLRGLAEAQTQRAKDLLTAVDRFLDEARLLAVTQSQKSRLAEAEQSWRETRQVLIKKDRSELEQICGQLEQGIGQTKGALSEGRVNDAGLALRELDAQVARRNRILFADTNELLSRFQRRSNELHSARIAYQIHAEQLRHMTEASTVLDYVRAAEGYVSLFPDDKLAKLLRGFLANDRCVRFDDTQPDNIWFRAREESRKRELEGLINHIGTLLTTPGYSSLWRVKARNIANAREMEFFFPQEPRPVTGETTLPRGARVKLYQPVYYRDMGEFQHLFEKKVLTLEIQEEPRFYLVCVSLTNVLTRLLAGFEAPGLSPRAARIAAFQTLATEGSFPAALRVSLIKELSRDQRQDVLAACNKHLPFEEKPFFERLAFKSKALEDGVNVSLNAFAEAIAFTPLDRLEETLANSALQRRVHFVGCADETGRPGGCASRRDGIRELWIPGDAMDAAYVAFEKKADGWSPVSGCPPPCPFAPLFAPQDETSTRELFRQIYSDPKNDKPRRFPDLWPRNMRE